MTKMGGAFVFFLPKRQKENAALAISFNLRALWANKNRMLPKARFGKSGIDHSVGSTTVDRTWKVVVLFVRCPAHRKL